MQDEFCGTITINSRYWLRRFAETVFSEPFDGVHDVVQRWPVLFVHFSISYRTHDLDEIATVVRGFSDKCPEFLRQSARIPTLASLEMEGLEMGRPYTALFTGLSVRHRP